MIIAVAYENGNVASHFGKAPAIKLYEIGPGHQITNTKIEEADESGHVARIGIMIMNKANALICGNIGKNAFDWLQNMHVHVFTGATGSADESIDALFRRELTELKSENCSHLEPEQEGCSSNCSSCSHHCS